MTRTELFKLRTHRTPWVLLAILVASLLIAPIYFAVKRPSDGAELIETYTSVFAVLAPLLGVVLGGWVLGHEFRQGTLRRVLGNDARRGRLVATKAAVAFGALTFGMLTAAGIGALASTASAASFGEPLVWNGVARDLLASGSLVLVPAAVAFGFSILLRSDTYAMVGALALMVILGPLLALIPRIGKYTPSALANDVTLWIARSEEELAVAIAPASLGLIATIGILGAAATVTFQRRDI